MVARGEGVSQTTDDSNRQQPMRRTKRKLFAVALRSLALLLAIVICTAVLLWNWPLGFYKVATFAGRLGAGVSLRYVDVERMRTPLLDSGATLTGDSPQEQPTAILFLHGWGTSKEAMLGEMRWFARTRRVIAPDLPGFGENPISPDQPAFTATDYLRWIEALRIALNLGRIDVVGESMGAALAAAYAAAYPDSVRRIVLQSPAGVRAPRTNAFMTAVERGENPLIIESGQDFDRVLRLCFVKPPPVPAPFKAYLVERALSQRQKHGELIETMREFLLKGNEAILSSIKAPTLILYGDRDQITDSSMLDVYRDGIPGAEGVLIPGQVM